MISRWSCGKLECCAIKSVPLMTFLSRLLISSFLIGQRSTHTSSNWGKVILRGSVPVCDHIAKLYTQKMLVRGTMHFFCLILLLETGKLLKFPPWTYSVCTTHSVIWLYCKAFIDVCDPSTLAALSALNVRFVCFSKCHLTEQNGTLLSRQGNFSLLLCWPWNKKSIFSSITSYKSPFQLNHFAAGWSYWLCQFSFL